LLQQIVAKAFRPICKIGRIRRYLESREHPQVGDGNRLDRFTAVDVEFQQERVTAIAERITTRINEQIRISPIRVIGSGGEQLGIIPVDQALAKARESELDLVEVAPNERPPVCRIMDFGKYKYEKKKKSHQTTHHTKTKEIRLRPKTGDHDIDFKIKQARGFLEHKDKVVVTVVFRGRELAHIDEGRKVMDKVVAELLEVGKVEGSVQNQGKRMICTIMPK
jgi:translation initiation factor IF-3